MLLRRDGGVNPSFMDNVKRSFIHAISYYISQVLMMIFMAYNGYFCVSLVFGRFVGFLLVQQFCQKDPLNTTNDGNSLGNEIVKSCCS